MKIAIHHRKGSFSDNWIEYCERKKIPYKIVNCFDNDIVEQVKDYDALMWHHNHSNFKDVKVAKLILNALEHSGIIVFPDFRTSWHFDNKVAQKYLLEAIGASVVPSFVFYDKKKALDWAKNTSYPKVFKLKGGAGSVNVKLVHSETQCINIINRSFGKGYKLFDGKLYFLDVFKKYLANTVSFQKMIKAFARIIIPSEFEKNSEREKGYVYFQNFLPNNSYDTRVIVIGDKILAEKRHVVKNDFRASGSGLFTFDNISVDVLKLSYEVSKKLKLQSCAFDIIVDETNSPHIIEISYGFGTKGILNAPGYWSNDFKFHKGKVNPQEWMVDLILKNSSKN